MFGIKILIITEKLNFGSTMHFSPLLPVSILTMSSGFYSSLHTMASPVLNETVCDLLFDLGVSYNYVLEKL